MTTLARPLHSGPYLVDLVWQPVSNLTRKSVRIQRSRRSSVWDNTARDDESGALHCKCSVFESIHRSERSLDFAKKWQDVWQIVFQFCSFIYGFKAAEYSLRNELFMKAAGFKCRWMMTHYFSIDVFSQSGFLFKKIQSVCIYIYHCGQHCHLTARGSFMALIICAGTILSQIWLFLWVCVCVWRGWKFPHWSFHWSQLSYF